MKRFLSIFIAALLLLSLAACNRTDKLAGVKTAIAPIYPQGIDFEDFEAWHKLRDDNPVADDTTSAIRQFSFVTASQILKESKTNRCYSPLSLYYALALSTTGAGGPTRDELLALLGVQNISQLPQQCGNLYRTLYTDNKISKLIVANSLWLDQEASGQEISFKEDFINNAVEHFYASLFTADFSDENTGKAMSRWISENTNGTLAPDFQIDSQQIMSILNTVYFYDQWIDRFNKDDTKEDTFYTENGEESICEFMNMTYGSHGFAVGDGYIRSSLGLKENGAMIFILPDEDVTVADLLATPQKLEGIFTQGEDKFGKVVWSVPKFEYPSNFDLTDTLKTLGVRSAFSLENADFSNMTDAPAFLSAIKQETHIAIDENGVGASAFTQIDYAGAAPPEDTAEMILNRPFIYGITARNGALLFVGVCTDPAAF